eukprot:TRINITY_DN60405_c0_g1_i1.p1 TRINITY_DN60405_c0_g1~~TRINITY_DN60405_c0_g1_i1.p1  ORF type:complete len:1355 (+),score=160.14 TRINITY_DN60405_c0_g1_i1:251-4066(+)
MQDHALNEEEDDIPDWNIEYPDSQHVAEIAARQNTGEYWDALTTSLLQQEAATRKGIGLAQFTNWDILQMDAEDDLEDSAAVTISKVWRGYQGRKRAKKRREKRRNRVRRQAKESKVEYGKSPTPPPAVAVRSTMPRIREVTGTVSGHYEMLGELNNVYDTELEWRGVLMLNENRDWKQLVKDHKDALARGRVENAEWKDRKVILNEEIQMRHTIHRLMVKEGIAPVLSEEYFSGAYRTSVTVRRTPRNPPEKSSASSPRTGASIPVHPLHSPLPPSSVTPRPPETSSPATRYSRQVQDPVTPTSSSPKRFVPQHPLMRGSAPVRSISSRQGYRKDAWKRIPLTQRQLENSLPMQADENFDRGSIERNELDQRQELAELEIRNRQLALEFSALRPHFQSPAISPRYSYERREDGEEVESIKVDDESEMGEERREESAIPPLPLPPSANILTTLAEVLGTSQVPAHPLQNTAVGHNSNLMRLVTMPEDFYDDISKVQIMEKEKRAQFWYDHHLWISEQTEQQATEQKEMMFNTELATQLSMFKSGVDSRNRRMLEEEEARDRQAMLQLEDLEAHGVTTKWKTWARRLLIGEEQEARNIIMMQWMRENAMLRLEGTNSAFDQVDDDEIVARYQIIACCFVEYCEHCIEREAALRDMWYDQQQVQRDRIAMLKLWDGKKIELNREEELLRADCVRQWEADLPGIHDLRQRDKGLSVVKEGMREEFDKEEWAHRWGIYTDEIYQRLFLMQQWESIVRLDLDETQEISWDVLIHKFNTDAYHLYALWEQAQFMLTEHAAFCEVVVKQAKKDSHWLEETQRVLQHEYLKEWQKIHGKDSHPPKVQRFKPSAEMRAAMAVDPRLAVLLEYEDTVRHNIIQMEELELTVAMGQLDTRVLKGKQPLRQPRKLKEGMGARELTNSIASPLGYEESKARKVISDQQTKEYDHIIRFVALSFTFAIRMKITEDEQRHRMTLYNWFQTKAPTKRASRFAAPQRYSVNTIPQPPATTISPVPPSHPPPQQPNFNHAHGRYPGPSGPSLSTNAKNKQPVMYNYPVPPGNEQLPYVQSTPHPTHLASSSQAYQAGQPSSSSSNSPYHGAPHPPNYPNNAYLGGANANTFNTTGGSSASSVPSLWGNSYGAMAEMQSNPHPQGFGRPAPPQQKKPTYNQQGQFIEAPRPPPSITRSKPPQQGGSRRRGPSPPYVVQDAAAGRIQKAWRVHKATKYTRRLRREQEAVIRQDEAKQLINYSATKIQAQVRRYLAILHLDDEVSGGASGWV